MTDELWIVGWNTNREGVRVDIEEGKAWCYTEEDRDALLQVLKTSRYIHSVWITDSEGEETTEYA